MAAQLECRICITKGHRADRMVEVGMYDPVNLRYVPLGAHGPDQRVIDQVIRDLKVRMEREGHMVTFSEQTGPRS